MGEGRFPRLASPCSTRNPATQATPRPPQIVALASNLRIRLAKPYIYISTFFTFLRYYSLAPPPTPAIQDPVLSISDRRFPCPCTLLLCMGAWPDLQITPRSNLHLSYIVESPQSRSFFLSPVPLSSPSPLPPPWTPMYAISTLGHRYGSIRPSKRRIAHPMTVRTVLDCVLIPISLASVSKRRAVIDHFGLTIRIFFRCAIGVLLTSCDECCSYRDVARRRSSWRVGIGGRGCLLCLVLAPQPRSDRPDLTSQLTGALIIPAIIQKAQQNLTLHHAVLVLNFATLSCVASLSSAPLVPIWRGMKKKDETMEQFRREELQKTQGRKVLSFALLTQIILQWVWAVLLFVDPYYAQVPVRPSRLFSDGPI